MIVPGGEERGTTLIVWDITRSHGLTEDTSVHAFKADALW